MIDQAIAFFPQQLQPGILAVLTSHLTHWQAWLRTRMKTLFDQQVYSVRFSIDIETSLPEL